MVLVFIVMLLESIENSTALLAFVGGSVKTNESDAPAGGREGGPKMPKNKQPLTSQQELFIRMSARGKPRKEVMLEVFKVDLDTETDRQKIHAVDSKMSRWRKLPEFETVWKDEVRTVLRESAGKALRILDLQMTGEDGSGQPWLQNKAANDLLAYGKSQIFGDEEKTVTVRIDGMPDLGSPDDGESGTAE